jgi:hypothetical protein
MKKQHAEHTQTMVQQLRAREQERTADMVRRQVERMTLTLASQRDIIKQQVCEEIKQNMVGC